MKDKERIAKGVRQSRARSIEDVVHRAVEDAFFDGSLYSRDIYGGDVYARDAEVDFEDMYF